MDKYLNAVPVVPENNIQLPNSGFTTPEPDRVISDIPVHSGAFFSATNNQ
ncbi:MAG: hypothetical protein JW917_00695 [Ignavibacteria bacterium]|nr:hypothetical protein [Ignavibacteria bacterium]